MPRLLVRVPGWASRARAEEGRSARTEDGGALLTPSAPEACEPGEPEAARGRGARPTTPLSRVAAGMRMVRVAEILASTREEPLG
ncbi:hypothetical protein CAC01_01850 [Streptomyces sp. CLI2509]|nr:hypothetical protein CAC01_01850 [Streptomyces sp. CLI2509]